MNSFAEYCSIWKDNVCVDVFMFVFVGQYIIFQWALVTLYHTQNAHHPTPPNIFNSSVEICGEEKVLVFASQPNKGDNFVTIVYGNVAGADNILSWILYRLDMVDLLSWNDRECWESSGVSKNGIIITQAQSKRMGTCSSMRTSSGDQAFVSRWVHSKTPKNRLHG